MKMAIKIEAKEVMKILADLEFLVVSLDHIGSAELSEEERKNEVYEFVTEGKVFRRLATMRKNISLALDQATSPSEQRAIERRLEKVKAWKAKR